MIFFVQVHQTHNLIIFQKLLKFTYFINYFPPKNNFAKFFLIRTFIDDCNELISYGRGVAQLGSAGALGAYLFTNETSCNN